MLTHKYSILAIFWALMIVILSFLPNEKIPEITFLWSPDKLAHFVIYLILAILLALSMPSRWSNSKWKHILIMIICGIFGWMIEIFQPILTNRYFETYDIIANMAGTVVGTFTSSWIYRMIKKANK